jgi:CHAT domain-containing protein
MKISLNALGVTCLSLAWIIVAQAAGPVEPTPGSLLEQSRQMREQGLYRSAESTLGILSPTGLEPLAQAAYYREWGLVLMGLGKIEEADSAFKQGLEAAQQVGQPGLEAALLNDSGNASADRGDLATAAGLFDRAYAVALATGDRRLAFTAATNRARAATGLRDIGLFESSLQAALDAAGSGKDLTAAQWLTLGTLQSAAVRDLGLAARWRKAAFDSFNEALRLASANQDTHLSSYAYGFIGGLYEDERRLDEALPWTRQAEILAMSANAAEALYRWQWQAARILRAQGETDAAIAAYRQAISTLGGLRSDLGQGAGASFRERAAPVFFEYADLLLGRTRTLNDPAAVDRNLREVRATLEQVKVAEVQEYFQDQCVQATGGSTELDMIGAGSAIVYPVLLPDRTELLVSLPTGLKQFTTPVGSQALTREVREFRRHIERYDFRTDYVRHARQLYRWLIEPMEADLASAGIDTLVIVPDGPLRTIPLSALYDGQRFLVERFAIATTPGLTLTSPHPLERAQVDLFAGGLTEGVQGFSALPNVGTELDRISHKFRSETIRDQQFLVDTVQQRIARGSQEIVHIATHGQFDSDHTQSFLLAYDDKITMDRLQATIATRGRQQEPLELLVLSACQTAAGDDRAALGLAGVALKAGARSALATLWFVNDESTARLVEDFYTYLADPANSKAKALQQAQLQLIHDKRFSHPAFWAPFLLIGNWL